MSTHQGSLENGPGGPDYPELRPPSYVVTGEVPGKRGILRNAFVRTADTNR